jgi:hypothetical protein
VHLLPREKFQWCCAAVQFGGAQNMSGVTQTPGFWHWCIVLHFLHMPKTGQSDSLIQCHDAEGDATHFVVPDLVKLDRYP